MSYAVSSIEITRFLAPGTQYNSSISLFTRFRCEGMTLVEKNMARERTLSPVHTFMTKKKDFTNVFPYLMWLFVIDFIEYRCLF